MKAGMALFMSLGISMLPAPGLQAQEPGFRVFAEHCASCHGTDGNGGELGPNISTRVPLRSDEELATVIRQGFPAAGMPAISNISAADTTALLGMLRTLKPRFGTTPEHRTLTMAGGAQLAGLVLNESLADLQLLGDDQQLYLLRKATDGYSAVTSQVDWTSYNGGMNGSRYSALDQINSDNVATLAPRWLFNFTTNSNLQVTPVVSEGVMYVTSANEAYALDAGSGREIWRYLRPRTRGLIGNAAGGANRGAAIAGDRLFMVTDHAHIIALDKHSGALLWDTEMADWRQNYNATGAPLPVGDLVITGTSGGDEGVRGFVAAYDQISGEEVWRWWSTPLPGEPGADTWEAGLEHPAGATWMTGAYDAELDTLYWTVGNPGPDLIGEGRPGDNLYTDSVVALDPRTGEFKWHFQFTPHDVWDYDAQEPTALVDAVWEGQPRKLLIQANRNGFFYVLDRTNGEFLSGWQFVKEVSWASGLDANGRPLRVPGMEPSAEGKRVCPSLTGATNWYSASFNPLTNLYYVQTDDKCGIFTRIDMEWEAGRGYMGGSFAPAPEPAQRVLRAIDIFSGATAWEVPQAGRASSWGGVLSTAGGIVIFGEDSGALMAADASTGAALWRFQANARWRASPMTYVFNNQQYIAIAAGSTIMAFALPEP